MTELHWEAESTSYRIAPDHRHALALVYNPTPGGVKNPDGSTTYSLRFPALLLTEYVSDPDKVAAQMALELNNFSDLLEALKACASLLPKYRMAGRTTADDEELAAVLERTEEALLKAGVPA